MMTGRPGRRRDNPSPMRQPRHSSSLRFDEKKPCRMKNPASRHLWVGNLARGITQSTLVDQFYWFGELESVSFQPGRSYAFVNYDREEDAIAALKSLQGFSLSGMPLSIEFAKSDKSSAPRDESNYRHRDELQPPSRRSAFLQRESRVSHASPDSMFADNLRTGDNSDDHPSEILWIGFPSFLKVDESILRKQFSPFGDIEKITVFQGRTYAFVQFRNIESACKAKEILQGKLFGNPRVHICFSRNGDTSSNTRWQDTAASSPSSSRSKSNDLARSSDRFQSHRHFVTMLEDPSTRPPQFPDREYPDNNFRSFTQKESPWIHAIDAYKERRFNHMGPDAGALHGRLYGRSPARDGSAQFREISPRNLTRKSIFPENEWELPEGTYIFREQKKMRTDSFSCERELPDYPFLNVDQGKHGMPEMAPNFRRPDECRLALPYRRPPDQPVSVNSSSVDRHNDWMPSHDTYQSPLSAFSSNSIDGKRNNMELRKPGVKEVWKWEGTIAKGGTPVCRARCFPVGKIMDVILPEFLDCTARTDLDMLAKHYYQAAKSWVVFFVAASDIDMGYYNEFMHYLGGKQRAAVAKLDERNTLFLIPPSDFSENVLKVPGKLSISGVVLSLEPSSPSVARLPIQRSHGYALVDTLLQTEELPSGALSSPASFFSPGLAASSSLPSVGNMTISAQSLMPADDHSESVADQGGYRNEAHLSSHAATLPAVCPPKQPNKSYPYSVSDDHQHSISRSYDSDFCRGINRVEGISYIGGNESALQEYKLPTSVPLTPSAVRPDQLSQLTSLLLQQKQSANSYFQAVSEASGASESVGYHPESQTILPARYPGPQGNQLPSDSSSSHFSQLLQPHQPENIQAVPVAGGIRGVQDESEADPQKRLQATLQLAAALLQQIQQGK